MRKSNYTMEFLFPILLFFVFACSALVLLLFASNTYEHVVTSSNCSFESGTSLSYVVQKIRQCDTHDSISLGTFDGQDALIIKEVYDGKTYVTYIYEHEGFLKELFLQEGVSASVTTGTSIIKVTDFTMNQTAEGLFQFACTGVDGLTDSVTLGTYTH